MDINNELTPEDSKNGQNKEKLSYFISNKIIEYQNEKTFNDYYCSIPFKLYSLLFKSFTEESIQITNKLIIPQKIWDIHYFDNSKLQNVSQKKNIFILYNYRIEMFLLEFKKQRKITSKLMENLSKEMNENFVNKALNSNSNNYLKISKEVKKDIENLKNKNYMEIIRFLIQNALRMNEVLKISNMNNYDYIEDDKEKEEVKNVQNSRINISSFFSKVILKIILNDLNKVLLAFIKEENEKCSNFI
jgi:hypothetical protein